MTKPRRNARRSWAIGSAVIVSVMALPLGTLIYSLFGPQTQAWVHIRTHLLSQYVFNTIALVSLTMLLAGTIGAGLAWIVTAYEFPGRRWLQIAFVLPIAVPPYIAASTYASIVSYTGPIQVWLRAAGFTPNAAAFDIMHVPGAAVIFALFLYPYVYLVVRGFLHAQASQLIEAARVLGSKRVSLYWRVVFPLMRPALVGGLSLVAFEVLSDYGVVSYFGIDVFSTAIFKSWLGLSDIVAALKLSAMLLIAVATVLMIEKLARGSMSHAYASPRVRPLTRQRTKGMHTVVAVSASLLVVAFSLVIPGAQMIYWAIVSIPVISYGPIWLALATSIWLGLAGATLTTVFSVLISNHRRLWPDRFSNLLARIAVLGYSVPSTVIALAILSLVMFSDTYFNTSFALTPLVIIVAYTIRYLAVSLHNVDAGFERIGSRYAESSRTLGRGTWATLFNVDVPMMKAPLFAAFVLAFIDIVKELPIVLMLRPFNFSTLATTVFQYANDEMIPESSFASLLIIAIALIPTLFITSHQARDDAFQTPKGLNDA